MIGRLVRIAVFCSGCGGVSDYMLDCANPPSGDEPIPCTSVCTNELMAVNDLVRVDTADPDDGMDDWIELYNAGTETVQLEGYVLVNDESPVEQTFVLPSWELEPRACKLIIADADPKERGWHAGFNIQKEYGGLRLHAPSCQLADRVWYGRQSEYRSWGRVPDDGSPTWGYRDPPTPCED